MLLTTFFVFSSRIQGWKGNRVSQVDKRNMLLLLTEKLEERFVVLCIFCFSTSRYQSSKLGYSHLDSEKTHP